MKFIQTRSELERIHAKGAGLVLNLDGHKLHGADCYFVDSMDLSTPKHWYSSIHEVEDAGIHWTHHCMMCEIGTARTSGPSATSPARAAPPPPPPKGAPGGRIRVHGPITSETGVDAWSDAYIAYPPKPEALRDLRRALRASLRELKAPADRVLQAIFRGAKPPNADVENALVYNIDDTGRAFQSSARRGILFELSEVAPEPAPDGSRYACQFSYHLARRGRPFAHWERVADLAHWEGVEVDRLPGEKKLEAVWLALREADVLVKGHRASADTPFCVDLELTPPAGAWPTTAAFVKGLFDGAVAAFQAHGNPADADGLAVRLTRWLDRPAGRLKELLLDDGRASAGHRTPPPLRAW